MAKNKFEDAVIGFVSFRDGFPFSGFSEFGIEPLRQSRLATIIRRRRLGRSV